MRGELVTAEEKAERDLSFTEIRAPFDGVVGNKAVELGQYALPGHAAARARSAEQPPMSTPISRRPSSTRSAPARRSTSPSIPTAGGSCRASSPRSRRPRGRSSRCCRPTTRPAISPRSCSASRCASRVAPEALARRNGCGRACRSSPPSTPATKACRKPTLLGAVRPRRRGQRQGAQAVSARRGTRGAPRAGARARPSISTRAGSSPSSSWSSGCSWRSWTSRSSRRRCRRFRPACRPRRTKSPGCRPPI